MSFTDLKTENSLVVDIIGLIGGIVIAIGPSAQLIKIIKTGEKKDISFKWMFLYTIGMIGSLTYNSHYRNYPILIPAVFEAIIILIMFIIKIYAYCIIRKNRKYDEENNITKKEIEGEVQMVEIPEIKIENKSKIDV
jgi:uncharacterized protein with PQ loop repeat